MPGMKDRLPRRQLRPTLRTEQYVDSKASGALDERAITRQLRKLRRMTEAALPTPTPGTIPTLSDLDATDVESVVPGRIYHVQVEDGEDRVVTPVRLPDGAVEYRDLTDSFTVQYLGSITAPALLRSVGIDASGNIYVSGSDAVIRKYDALGNAIMQFGSLGASDSNTNLSNPQGIVIEPSGAIVVVNEGRNRLKRFEPDGSFNASSAAATVADLRGITYVPVAAGSSRGPFFATTDSATASLAGYSFGPNLGGQGSFTVTPALISEVASDGASMLYFASRATSEILVRDIFSNVYPSLTAAAFGWAVGPAHTSNRFSVAHDESGQLFVLDHDGRITVLRNGEAIAAFETAAIGLISRIFARNGYLYGINPVTGSLHIWKIPAEGKAGPPGAQGVAGPAGPIGVDGPAGPAGPTGANGQAGATGSTGPSGPVGPTGATGPQGNPGNQGVPGNAGVAGPGGPAGRVGPGLPHASMFFATTTAVPGEGGLGGRVNANNVALVAATTLYLATQDVQFEDVDLLWASLLAVVGSPKGRVRIEAVSNPNVWAEWDVTALTDVGNYFTLTITAGHATSDSPFTNGQAIYLTVMRNGSTGATGITGPAGATGATGATGPAGGFTLVGSPGTKSWAPGTIAAGTQASETVAVTGALTSDYCVCSHTGTRPGGRFQLTCAIDTAGVLSATYMNHNQSASGSVGNGTLKCSAYRP